MATSHEKAGNKTLQIYTENVLSFVNFYVLGINVIPLRVEFTAFTLRRTS